MALRQQHVRSTEEDTGGANVSVTGSNAQGTELELVLAGELSCTSAVGTSLLRLNSDLHLVLMCLALCPPFHSRQEQHLRLCWQGRALPEPGNVILSRPAPLSTADRYSSARRGSF